MKTWHASNSSEWTFGSALIAGHGGGMGQYWTSYALDTDTGQLLNGRVSAEIVLHNWQESGVGLVCRADELWSFVAFYVAPADHQERATTARFAVFHEGQVTLKAELNAPVELSEGPNAFSLEFFSGTVRGAIKAEHRSYELTAQCPDIPFPGYTGLVKLYRASMFARRFEAKGTDLPATPKPMSAGRAFDYDVFLCHSGEDAEVVRELADRLHERGVTYWLDAEQISFGDPVTQKIESGLDRSRFLVPCISDHLNKSGWTRGEYGAILNSELSGDSTRVVVPVVLNDASHLSIPLLLKDKKRVSYANSVEFEQFVRFLLSRR